MGNKNFIPAPPQPPPPPAVAGQRREAPPPPPAAVASQRREAPPPPSPQAATQVRERKPSEIENKREKEAEKNTKDGKQGHHQNLKPPEAGSLPKNLQDILKEADFPIDKSSTVKLYDQLYSSGLFLSHKTKKFWMNKKSNCNCFMLYARALSITWGEDHRYWKWIQLQESSGTMIEAAELKRVCWLEVHGRLDTRKLTPGVMYQVCFHVMLKDPAQGWEVPVNVRLVLPGGKRQEHKENLISKMRVQWMEIPVGQFVAPTHDEGGEMEFSLYEIEGGAWKQGLVIKGVSIKPNPNDYRISPD
ncbi:protein PHLOEM PROTEIN 2-LIKE A1-like [Neltuma alba]|uniref:protein PHLOEM PROTEIN 2-LIKE A1-like n=1 Tax=Neltuma alba TaxID=207710 RepID=UPI0010A48FCE|nr:protein PHLOEM PROTEIN 2-LIKE A1-like [Prosopis alba]XP_028759273.1 protein PHLOEM PROTEIN 2-LIKE A1-like [Prosopis alba]